LATSIKALEANVQDLRARVAVSPADNPGPAKPATTPQRGASVDPPPTLGATCFQLPGGVLNPYQGSDSFTPSNHPPRDTAPPHNRRHATDEQVSGLTGLSSLRRDPLAGNLREQPIHVTPNEGPTTPARNDTREDGNQIVGGAVRLPQPSNKERLARAHGIGLFDIAGLATTEYHGGYHGVPELTVAFIHNCGYQSFYNMVSLEDVLICFGEIQQIHRKVLQIWYNPPTLVSGPSIARILDKGFQAFPKLRSLNIQDAVKFYDKFQDLSKDYLLPLMPFDSVRLVNN
jgi:hypothetical protein